MRAMTSWSGIDGGGVEGRSLALLDGEEPSRFSIRPASASGFMEIYCKHATGFLSRGELQVSKEVCGRDGLNSNFGRAVRATRPQICILPCDRSSSIWRTARFMAW